MAISYAVRPAALTIASTPGAASRKLSSTLWTLQSLLAVIFLFSGAIWRHSAAADRHCVQDHTRQQRSALA